MASKKDKFRKEVKKSLGQDDPSMEGIVGEIAGRRTEKSRKEEDGSQQKKDTSESRAPSKPEAEKPGNSDKEQTADPSDTPSGPEFLAEVDEARASDSSRIDTDSETSSENPESENSNKEDPSGRIDKVAGKSGSREKTSAGVRENSSTGRSERIDSTGHSKKTGARPMARKRESIYNVSSDIRLEDYTEADRQKSNNSLFKMAGVVAVLLLLGFVIWQAAMYLMAPSYQLAMSNQEITGANIEQFTADPVSRLSAASPVHIRFQWPAGELKTDYLKILVERAEGSTYVEEAVLGRRPPRTASYIYFMGPLDAGKYRVQVLDASGSVLADRDLELQ